MTLTVKEKAPGQAWPQLDRPDFIKRWGRRGWEVADQGSPQEMEWFQSQGLSGCGVGAAADPSPPYPPHFAWLARSQGLPGPQSGAAPSGHIASWLPPTACSNPGLSALSRNRAPQPSAAHAVRGQVRAPEGQAAPFTSGRLPSSGSLPATRNARALRLRDPAGWARRPEAPGPPPGGRPKATRGGDSPPESITNSYVQEPQAWRVLALHVC